MGWEVVDWCGGRIDVVGGGRLVRWEVVDWWGGKWLICGVGGG